MDGHWCEEGLQTGSKAAKKSLAKAELKGKIEVSCDMHVISIAVKA